MQSISRSFDHELVQEAQRINAFQSNVAGAVCQSCNAGWMSGLETSVAHVVKKLIAGSLEFNRVSPADRIALARWACKIAYCWDLSLNNPSRVSPDHPKALYANTANLPDRVVVFGALSPISTPIDLVSDVSWIVGDFPAQRLGELDEDIHASYKYAMQFGHMVLLVVYWPNPEFILGFMPEYVTPIWIPQDRYMPGYPEFRPVFADSRQFLECMTKSIDLYPRESQGGIVGNTPLIGRPVPRRHVS